MRAVSCIEFAQDALYVHLDGARCSPQPVSDFFVSKTARNKAEHFDFARCERHFGDEALSGMHHVDGPNDFRVHHLLQEIAAHTCFESAIDILISVIRSECKKARLRELGADLPDGLHAVLIGQPQIHQRDIRPVLAKEPHRFLGGPCFRNQTHARFVCENGCNSFSNQFVIVNGKNCNHFSTFTKTSLDGLETGAAWLAKPAAQTCKGSSNDTRVPLPGELSIESSAPISSARSCIPSRPKWPN